MWARLRGVLARVGRWFLSPAGRAVWVRLLLFGASIPLAPYMVAVWRVAPYGQGAEQCLLFVAVAGVLLFRGGWRRLHALRAARDEDRQSEPDRARKPVRPAPEPGASPLSRPRNRSSRLISSSSSRMRFLLSSMARVMSCSFRGPPRSAM